MRDWKRGGANDPTSRYYFLVTGQKSLETKASTHALGHTGLWHVTPLPLPKSRSEDRNEYYRYHCLPGASHSVTYLKHVVGGLQPGVEFPSHLRRLLVSIIQLHRHTWQTQLINHVGLALVTNTSQQARTTKCNLAASYPAKLYVNVLQMCFFLWQTWEASGISSAFNGIDGHVARCCRRVDVCLKLAYFICLCFCFVVHYFTL